MVNTQEGTEIEQREVERVSATYDIPLPLLKKVLYKVLDQLTTQNVPAFYDSILEWIIFQFDNFERSLTINHVDPNNPKMRFYNRHPEAFWATQVIVEVFCDIVIPDLLSDSDEDQIDFIWECQQICNEIGIRLFDQLSCFTDGLDPDFVIGLSGEKYEGTGAEGLSLVIVPSELSIPVSLRFGEQSRLDLDITSVHAIRKQLNMAKSGALAVTRDVKTGHFRTVGLIPVDLKNRFPHFVFTGHMDWKFCIPVESKGIDCRLRYRQGSLKLPIVDLTHEVRTMLQAPFGTEGAEMISNVILAIDKLGQGAVMVVSCAEIIDAESQRLVNECERGICFMEPIDVGAPKTQDDMLTRFTAIDGAIFVDDKGFCHACGVILDGEAKMGAGDTGRGARYNCTSAYTASAHERYPNSNLLGVVKSEDGMLDLFLHCAAK